MIWYGIHYTTQEGTNIEYKEQKAIAHNINIHTSKSKLCMLRRKKPHGSRKHSKRPSPCIWAGITRWYPVKPDKPGSRSIRSNNSAKHSGSKTIPQSVAKANSHFVSLACACNHQRCEFTLRLFVLLITSDKLMAAFFFRNRSAILSIPKSEVCSTTTVCADEKVMNGFFLASVSNTLIPNNICKYSPIDLEICAVPSMATTTSMTNPFGNFCLCNESMERFRDSASSLKHGMQTETTRRGCRVVEEVWGSNNNSLYRAERVGK